VTELSFDHTGRPYNECVVGRGYICRFGGTPNAGDAAPDGGVLLGQQLYFNGSVGGGDQNPQFAGS
jgi:hypothetical protein